MLWVIIFLILIGLLFRGFTHGGGSTLLSGLVDLVTWIIKHIIWLIIAIIIFSLTGWLFIFI